MEGNGLGLAIVKAIVEQHNGEVTVESKPDMGSCFTLTLPIMQKELLNVEKYDLQNTEFGSR
jgi:two-component system OmpR family sensor kinase